MANSHVIVGKGPNKVIALHGWFGSARGWGPFVQVLDEMKRLKGQGARGKGQGKAADASSPSLAPRPSPLAPALFCVTHFLRHRDDLLHTRLHRHL